MPVNQAIVDRALDALRELNRSNQKTESAAGERPKAAPVMSRPPYHGLDFCADCYSVGEVDGRERFIHPAKPGVAAHIQPLPRRQVEIPCWHCKSTGACSCIACTDGLAAGARPECMVCHGTGKATQWVV